MEAAPRPRQQPRRAEEVPCRAFPLLFLVFPFSFSAILFHHLSPALVSAPTWMRRAFASAPTWTRPRKISDMDAPPPSQGLRHGRAPVSLRFSQALRHGRAPFRHEWPGRAPASLRSSLSLRHGCAPGLASSPTWTRPRKRSEMDALAPSQALPYGRAAFSLRFSQALPHGRAPSDVNGRAAPPLYSDPRKRSDIDSLPPSQALPHGRAPASAPKWMRPRPRKRSDMDAPPFHSDSRKRPDMDVPPPT